MSSDQRIAGPRRSKAWALVGSVGVVALLGLAALVGVAYSTGTASMDDVKDALRFLTASKDIEVKEGNEHRRLVEYEQNTTNEYEYEYEYEHGNWTNTTEYEYEIRSNAVYNWTEYEYEHNRTEYEYEYEYEQQNASTLSPVSDGATPAPTLGAIKHGRNLRRKHQGGA
jgi:hypothetical protein